MNEKARHESRFKSRNLLGVLVFLRKYPGRVALCLSLLLTILNLKVPITGTARIAMETSGVNCVVDSALHASAHSTPAAAEKNPDSASTASFTVAGLTPRSPVIAEVGRTLNVPPIQVGQAALLGQMTTGFPVSPLTPATFLVVGLSGIELGEHQRYTAPFLFAASVLMTVTCVVLGVFAL